MRGWAGFVFEKAGMVLALVSSGKITNPQEIMSQAKRYYVRKEVGKIAEKNGLTLYELNVLLAANSRLGNTIFKSGYDPSRAIDITGVTTRADSQVAGLVWDVNDLILGYQGLIDATGVDYINDPNRPSHITGHSLGALRANNLVRNGFADSAEIYSLPFGNSAAENVDAHLGALDLVNGGVVGKVFNPTERLDYRPSLWKHKSACYLGSSGC